MTAASNSDARKREAERAEQAARVDTYIALDGANEPTLWREGHQDQPISLFRRCDVGADGWAWIEAQFERMQRENRANLAAQDAHAAPVAPGSPSVAPESTASANGAQGANLTSEQQGRIDDAVIDDRDRADGYHCLGTGGLPTPTPTPTLHETVAAIVRDYRQEQNR